MHSSAQNTDSVGLPLTFNNSTSPPTRTHARRPLRSIPRSAVLATVVEDVQLELIRHSQPHDGLSTRGNAQTDPSDNSEPQAPFPNTRTSTLPPTYRELFKGLTYSPLLPNLGNLARDHLSIERTWLAYMRTSVVILGTGVGIVQYFSLKLAEFLEAAGATKHPLSTTVQRFARLLGQSAIFLALCLMVIGLWRYFKLQHAIMQGVFPAAQTVVILFSASLAIIVTVACTILLTLTK